MSLVDAGAPPKKGGGMMGVLIPLIVLTLLAAGGGALIGSQIIAALKKPAEPVVEKAPAAMVATPAPELATGTAVKELAPILTNLAAPDSGNWIRVQAAIVFAKEDGPKIDLITAQLSEDILAVMRTLTLAELQGASGLELLKEDLNERASIRSDGHIKELIIETLVIQ